MPWRDATFAPRYAACAAGLANTTLFSGKMPQRDAQLCNIHLSLPSTA
jgi:hypothetical protein